MILLLLFYYHHYLLFYYYYDLIYDFTVIINFNSYYFTIIMIELITV